LNREGNNQEGYRIILTLRKKKEKQETRLLIRLHIFYKILLINL